MNSTEKQMIMIRHMPQSWHTCVCSLGVRRSLGMETYMGKYSTCGYIKILAKDGLSSREKKATEFKRLLMRPWKYF